MIYYDLLRPNSLFGIYSPLSFLSETRFFKNADMYYK